MHLCEKCYANLKSNQCYMFGNEMKKEHVNLRKIDRMGVLAFQNAIRLHKDSVLLFHNQRFPSAYALSVLSLEEIGKYFMIEDFVFHCRIEGRVEPKQEEEDIRLIYNHRYKQNVFANQADFPLFAKRAIKSIYEGRIEKKKQDSIYVGLPRQGKGINLRGRLINPLKILRRQAEGQITLVNDFILCTAAGVLKGFFSVDIYDLEDVLTHDLIRNLRQMWPNMSASARKNFNDIMKHPDIADEE